MKLLFLAFLLLALPACSAASFLNAGIPQDDYVLTRDVAYGPDARQKLDIYQPENAMPGAPVVVFFYGGNWRSGNKADYRFVGEALASQGFVAVIADYRLYPQVTFPAFVEDGAAAVVWAHAHAVEFGGDPQHLFVMGHSAGAYNALMLAMNPAYLQRAGGEIGWLRGAIGLAGPYDFRPLDDGTAPQFANRRDDPATMPVTFATGVRPPVLLLTGTDDTTVRPRNSTSLSQQLQDHGSEATVHEYPGIGHIDLVVSLAHGWRDKAPTLRDVAAWVRGR